MHQNDHKGRPDLKRKVNGSVNEKRRFNGHHQEFYSEPYDEFVEENYNMDYKKGYDLGYDEGYRDGYNDGYGDHEYNTGSIKDGHPEDLRWHKRKSWSWYWL